ncbi:MAG: 30S ribosomal protein S20 [Candidatus Omnitrophica bacterium]|nr:30S ribosomal protein S20 [Candidatus Omnitrophota bacterium]
MPIQKASFKSLRQSKKRHLRNLAIKSELKTKTKKFIASLTGSDTQAAKTGAQELIKRLNKAKSKGIIHKKTASRKISRIMKKVSKLAA